MSVLSKRVLVVGLLLVGLLFLTGATKVFKKTGSRPLHGVTGAYGNEETLQYLYELVDIPMHVAGPTYYFGDGNATGDFPAADDTDDCLSPSTACVSWWKLRVLCRNANCILDAGDAQWLTTNVCTDVADGAAVPQVGGAADGICDEDSVTPYLPTTTVGPVHTASTAIDTNTGFGGTAANPVTRPWMNIRTSRPGTRVQITETTAADTGWLWHVRGGGAIILQDLEFYQFSTDVMLSESGIQGFYDGTRLIANNVRCTETIGAADRCFRFVGGHAIILNSEADQDDSPSIHLGEDGLVTWISTKTLEKTNSNDNIALINISAGDPADPDCCPGITMIGPTLTLSGTTGGTDPELIKSLTANANAYTTIRVARTQFNGGPSLADAGGCIQFSSEGTTPFWNDIEVYQSTFAYCTPVFHNITAVNTKSANERLVAKYNVFQSGLQGNFGVFYATSGGFTTGTYDIRDNIVNEENDAQPSFISIEDEVGTTINDNDMAAFNTKILAESAAMQATLTNFFQDTENTATDTEQFGLTCTANPGTGGSGTCQCTRRKVALNCIAADNPWDCCTARAAGVTCTNNADECATAIPSTYTIELMAPIPKEIFGSAQDVKYLTLGDVHTNYGAY